MPSRGRHACPCAASTFSSSPGTDGWLSGSMPNPPPRPTSSPAAWHPCRRCSKKRPCLPLHLLHFCSTSCMAQTCCGPGRASEPIYCCFRTPACDTLTRKLADLYARPVVILNSGGTPSAAKHAEAVRFCPCGVVKAAYQITTNSCNTARASLCCEGQDSVLVIERVGLRPAHGAIANACRHVGAEGRSPVKVDKQPVDAELVPGGVEERVVRAHRRSPPPADLVVGVGTHLVAQGTRTGHLGRTSGPGRRRRGRAPPPRRCSRVHD
mmetsp:Transcript_115851/g.368340  ORF Transcript_115851/g.368340 Transcript_115851/m.368340 type:complete len:267 (-) Transcript_115851:45-845(-)